MNKTLWKLQIAGERLWLLANVTAQQAAALDNDGKGVAVVAEETRRMANTIYELVERTLFDEKEIQPGNVSHVAFQLNLLALNAAFESSRIGLRGKPTAVCADEIRNLAYEVTLLLDGNNAAERHNAITPYPKNRMTSVEKRNELLLLNLAGIFVVEPLANIKEVCSMDAERMENRIKLRGMEVPLIDGYKMLGKAKEKPTYVLLHTPWAEQNKIYAVAADVSCIFFSPTGTPIAAPSDMPLAEYAREYWESENDTPFLFMDWPKMAAV